MVQLSEELVEALDREAERLALSRSALIRDALAKFLADRQADRDVERYLDGYRRLPPGRPDEWGDLQACGDRAGHELAQRLDAEEAAQGLAW